MVEFPKYQQKIKQEVNVGNTINRKDLKCLGKSILISNFNSIQQKLFLTTEGVQSIFGNQYDATLF